MNIEKHIIWLRCAVNTIQMNHKSATKPSTEQPTVTIESQSKFIGMGARCRASPSRARSRRKVKEARIRLRRSPRGPLRCFGERCRRRAVRFCHRSEKDEIKLRLMMMIAIMMAISVMGIIQRIQINCHRRTNYVRRMFSMLTDSRRGEELHLAAAALRFEVFAERVAERRVPTIRRADEVPLAGLLPKQIINSRIILIVATHMTVGWMCGQSKISPALLN